MKAFVFGKIILCITFVFFLFSCKKTNSDTSAPPPPISLTDTGINYSASAICDYNMDETTLTSTGWTKVFEDNFDGDLSKWNVYNSGQGGKELNAYQTSNAITAAGALQIIAKKETVTALFNQTQKTYPYTSGLIESKTTFSANTTTPKARITARIKIARGYGMTSYFTSKGEPWPTQGQIDLIRKSDFEPNIYINNYYYGNTPNINLVRNSYGYITSSQSLTECYHVYELEWSKNSLIYYLDGKVVEQKTSGGYIPDLFGKTQHLMLYLTVSSDFIYIPQIKTGTLYMDWVKVFTSK